MSTAELEAEVAPDDVPPLHEGDPVATMIAEREAEVKAEDDADPIPADHEIARAEGEGMVAVDPPTPAPSTRQQIEDAEFAEAIEKATEEVCHYQERAEVKKSEAVRLKEEASDAKKASEAADDDLREAARRLRKLREGQFPDAHKYPLLDRKQDASDAAKAEVNAMFPKPEAIQPGMPSTLEDLQAIRARDTTLESLKFGKQILAKFAKAGATTVREFGEKPFEEFGFTEGQADTVREAMGVFWDGVKRSWDEAHPEASAEGGGTAVGDDGPDEDVAESDRMHREAFDQANPMPDADDEVDHDLAAETEND